MIKKIRNISKNTYLVELTKDLEVNGLLIELTKEDLNKIKRDRNELKTGLYEIKLISNENIIINQEIFNAISDAGLLDNLDERMILMENSTGQILFNLKEYREMIISGVDNLNLTKTGDVREPKRPYNKKENIKQIFNQRYNSMTSKMQIYREIANEMGISYKAVEKAILQK